MSAPASPRTFPEIPSARFGPGGPPAENLHAGPWLLFLFGAVWPRLFIVGFWIFSSEIGDAFSSWVIPAIGFVVLPWTTFAYAIMWGLSSEVVAGWEWIVVGIALLLDVATWAAATRLRS